MHPNELPSRHMWQSCDAGMLFVMSGLPGGWRDLHRRPAVPTLQESLSDLYLQCE